MLHVVILCAKADKLNQEQDQINELPLPTLCGSSFYR